MWGRLLKREFKTPRFFRLTSRDAGQRTKDRDREREKERERSGNALLAKWVRLVFVLEVLEKGGSSVAHISGAKPPLYIIVPDLITKSSDNIGSPVDHHSFPFPLPPFHFFFHSSVFLSPHVAGHQAVAIRCVRLCEYFDVLLVIQDRGGRR